MSRLVSFAVLIGILILFVVLFYRVMGMFLLPGFMAALMFVVFQPVFRWSMRRANGRRYFASAITTILVLLAVLAPVGIVASIAGVQGLDLLAKLEVKDVRDKLETLRDQMGLDIPRVRDLRQIEATLDNWHSQQRQGDTPSFTEGRVDNLLRRVDRIDGYLRNEGASAPNASTRKLREALEALRITKAESVERDDKIVDVSVAYRSFKRDFLGGAFQVWLKELVNPSEDQIEELKKRFVTSTGSPLVTLGSDTVSLVVKLVLGLVITLAALFFMFAEGNRILSAAIRLSPLEEKYVLELVAEFDRVCRAVVAATLLSALAQGILAGVGFYFAGLASSIALLVMLTILLAMVPFTGAAAVWLPVALYLYFVEQKTTAAVLLAVYGAAVVSTVDNFIKPVVLHGQSKLHPLLALLSVIGGIQALGPIGILVGPMVVVFLQTLLKILQRELLSMDNLPGGGLKAAWASATSSGGSAQNAAEGEVGKESSSNKSDDNADSPSSQDEGAASSSSKPKPPSSAASVKQNNKKGKK